MTKADIVNKISGKTGIEKHAVQSTVYRRESILLYCDDLTQVEAADDLYTQAARAAGAAGGQRRRAQLVTTIFFLLPYYRMMQTDIPYPGIY